MKIPVDSPLVMRNSRHAITEAGLDTIVENLRKSGTRRARTIHVRRAQLSRTEKPAGLERACHHFVRRTATGETWNVYLDRARCCRAWFSPRIRDGELIERYVYREIRENPDDLAAAGAFEPDSAGANQRACSAGSPAPRWNSTCQHRRLDDALTAKVTRNQAFVAENHRPRRRNR